MIARLNQEVVDNASYTAKRIQTVLFFSRELDELEKLNIHPAVYVSEINISYLTHEQMVQVMKVFGGSWKKEVERCGSEDRMFYRQRREIEGREAVDIECSSTPPSSCRIEEVVVEVPAQPATTKIVRRIVCPHSGDDAAAQQDVPAEPDVKDEQI